MKKDVVARVAVAAIGAAVLLLAASGAVGAFTSALAPDDPSVAPGLADDAAKRALAREQHAQFECIRGELRRTLPPGAVVHVPLDPASADPDLWKQRLTEMAFPLATVVDEPGPGVTTLVVVADPGGACTGVRLVATAGAA